MSKAQPSIPVDPGEFRRVLGHYPTGVCAITSVCDDRPIGLVVGSFTSVSLAPPLVGFFPDRRSETWPRIRAAGRFCVNVLGDDQRAVCQALAAKGADKFAGLDYRWSETGLPILADVAAWIECELYTVHEAGDHQIALGSVVSFHAEVDRRPMLFYRGGYGGFGS